MRGRSDGWELDLDLDPELALRIGIDGGDMTSFLYFEIDAAFIFRVL